MRRTAGDRSRDGRRDVDGAVRHERRCRHASGAARARTGRAGYAYAGFQSAGVSSGVRATIAATRAPSVQAGHAAAWIGVGGKSAGPKGETMWLQTGVARCRTRRRWSTRRSRAPARDPVFVPLLQNVQVGERHRLAVLEMNRRPGVWRVWVDGKPMTDPIVLPGSHRIWKPIATAESWNGGVATCNGFGFRFERVGVARSLGGSWRTFAPGYTFEDRGYVVRQLRPAPAGQRTLASDPIQRIRVRRRLGCVATAAQPATILTGVPTRTSLRSARTSLLRRRTQPCDTAWPISHGVFVPWTPTTPPPGQSESFE